MGIVITECIKIKKEKNPAEKLKYINSLEKLDKIYFLRKQLWIVVFFCSWLILSKIAITCSILKYLPVSRQPAYRLWSKRLCCWCLSKLVPNARTACANCPNDVVCFVSSGFRHLFCNLPEANVVNTMSNEIKAWKW